MSTEPRPFVLVTGLSGAGKASILRILEDLGFETVDNPPLAILDALVQEGAGPSAPDLLRRALDALAGRASMTSGAFSA